MIYLRRTCATGLQRVGTPLVVTEAILGHVGSRGGVVGIYQRHAFRDEKAAAIEKWPSSSGLCFLDERQEPVAAHSVLGLDPFLHVGELRLDLGQINRVT